MIRCRPGPGTAPSAWSLALRDLALCVEPVAAGCACSGTAGRDGGVDPPIDAADGADAQSDDAFSDVTEDLASESTMDVGDSNDSTEAADATDATDVSDISEITPDGGGCTGLPSCSSCKGCGPTLTSPCCCGSS